MTDILLFDALPEYLRDDISRGVGRCVCPKCGGGTGRERSLDVRQDAETAVMRLKCWRSSCDWYGITVTDPNAKIQSKAIKPATPYNDPTTPIDATMCYFLEQSYGLKRDEWSSHGWRLGPNRQLVMPVLDPWGLERGVVTRTFDTPKRCYTFKTTAMPWLDYWLTGDLSEPLVLVEDTLSACRLSGLGISAVALLGTSLSIEQVKEIKEFAHVPVYIALDNDAFVKSLKLVDRHRHVLDMKPVLLTQDIKAMQSDDAIRGLFNGRN